MVAVQVVLKGHVELMRSVKAIEKGLGRGTILKKVGKALTRETLKTVRKLTPIAKNPRSPLAVESGTDRIKGHFRLRDQWKIMGEAVNKNAYAALIRNQAVDSTLMGAAILSSIEKGARPHSYAPAPGKAFRWPRVRTQRSFLGRSVADDPAGSGLFVTDLSTQSTTARRGGKRKKILKDSKFIISLHGVSHPGHKAFYPVRNTLRQMNLVAAVFLAKTGEDIGRMWVTGVDAGVSSS